MPEYFWEIEFEGCKVHEVDQKNLPREQRIDPQNPPIELGAARFIRLIPQSDQWPLVTVVIPNNAKPVCHRYVVEATDGVSGFACRRIGWRIENVRNIISVNLKTREIVGLITQQ